MQPKANRQVGQKVQKFWPHPVRYKAVTPAALSHRRRGAMFILTNILKMLQKAISLTYWFYSLLSLHLQVKETTCASFRLFFFSKLHLLFNQICAHM